MLRLSLNENSVHSMQRFRQSIISCASLEYVVAVYLHLPPPAYKLLYLCQTIEGGGGGNEGKVTQRSRNKHLFNTVKFPDLFALSVSHNLHQDFTFNSFIKHIYYSVSLSIQYTIHNKHSTLGFHKPPRYLKETLL